MPDDFEARIAQALTDAGGPSELAPQLIALADMHGLTTGLEKWIQFHVGEEWSAAQFDAWCKKMRDLLANLNRKGETIR